MAAEARPPPEQNHSINSRLGILLEEEDDIYPGINCCAVCGSNDDLINCENCDRICYCNNSLCQIADLKTHQLVCSYLKDIDDLDISYNGDNGIEIDNDIVTECVNEVFKELENISLGSKRQLKNWKTIFNKNSIKDEKYHKYVSAMFSYSLSIGWCLENIPMLKKYYNNLKLNNKSENGKVKEETCISTKTYVDILILGASGAECAVSTNMWALSIFPQISSDMEKYENNELVGLRITFVGPEIPSNLHLNVIHDQQNKSKRNVCLRYYQGELVDLINKGENVFDMKNNMKNDNVMKLNKLKNQKRDLYEMNQTTVDEIFKELCVDMIFAFNMGLTVAEYPWSSSLNCLIGDVEDGRRNDDEEKANNLMKKCFIMLTNTELELNLDRECLEYNHGIKLKKVI